MTIANQIPEQFSRHKSTWSGCAQRLDTFINPIDALRRVQHLNKSIMLHSSMQNAKLGRYSFLMADPFDWIQVESDVASSNTGSTNSFHLLRNKLAQFQVEKQSSLPPFQGGAAGFLSYDLNRSLESLPAPRICDFAIPVIAFGLYDTVVAWDHLTKETWIISQGFPEREGYQRQKRATDRAEYFAELVLSDVAQASSVSTTTVPFFETPLQQIPADIYSPFDCPGYPKVTSNMSREVYDGMIAKAIEYIYAGDIYQVNLSQRLIAPAICSSFELFEKLCRVNPAPFSAWLDLGGQQVISCSPERLAKISDRKVETRPIKGTRKRTRFPQVDLAAKAELESSEKDRAENVMIVDLMRNDLSKVCKDHSIVVKQLLKTEAYESVLHLVSSVEGELSDECDCLDFLQAVFPGGSITGAPKIRAMEIIAELEPTARGAYCGSLGYIGFDGSMDFSILIRSITASRGCWQIPVGGGIVAQSNAESEYVETWTKAAAMLRAVTGAAK